MTRYFLLAAAPVVALGPIGLCALALWAMSHQPLHEEEQ